MLYTEMSERKVYVATKHNALRVPEGTNIACFEDDIPVGFVTMEDYIMIENHNAEAKRLRVGVSPSASISPSASPSASLSPSVSASHSYSMSPSPSEPSDEDCENGYVCVEGVCIPEDRTLIKNGFVWKLDEQGTYRMLEESKPLEPLWYEEDFVPPITAHGYKIPRKRRFIGTNYTGPR